MPACIPDDFGCNKPMGLLLVILLLYWIWGLPVLILFNYFFTRSFYPSMDLLSSSGLAFAVSLIIFMPLINPAGSFFGDTLMPWYVAVSIPPKPIFETLPVLITMLTSALSIGVFQWMLRRNS